MNIADPATYLRRDNPRLIQLEAEYAALDLPFAHTAWRTHQYAGVDIANFRADGAYLGQDTASEQAYLATYEYVRSIDSEDWLDRLDEDGAFGVYVPPFIGKRFSRDLLDSIMELYFVQRSIGLPPNWMDIGAGYGRLAHRLLTVRPHARVIMLDAVPVSTFLCEFYADYRGFADKVHVGPLTEVLSTDYRAVDIACNIHSWSECSANAINFWLDNLIQWQVPYLFVVPHDERWVCVNEDGTIGNFKPLIEQHGFEEIYSRPKYPDGVDGLFPEVSYHMFKRRR